MKLAIVQIKGTIGANHRVRDTLRMLGLGKPNRCVIKEDTPSLRGMIQKAETYITWGPADEKTLGSLPKDQTTFGLNPPKKGYGRKGIKMPFKFGGGYGDRKEKINDLITRML